MRLFFNPLDMIKHFTYFDFFPYAVFRKDQEEIIYRIEKSARQGNNILLVAPNGTGKTVMALSGLLPLVQDKGLKIVYLCRTHAQSSRVIQELIRIKDSLAGTNTTVTGISIRGRNDMCLNPLLLKLRASPSESMGVCADLRKNNNCAYYRNVRKLNEGIKNIDLYEFNRPVDSEELMDYCTNNKYCPYFLAKYLLKDMGIVVCNYQWVLNPDIRFRFFKLLDTSLDKIILVIDECHNIVDVATSVNSHRLIPSVLTTCISDMLSLKMPDKFRQFATYLKNQLDQKKKDLHIGETEVNPKEVLEQILRRLKLGTKTEFKRFLQELGGLYANFDSKAKDKARVSQNQIPYLVKFWLNWSSKTPLSRRLSSGESILRDYPKI
jgi:DNA excision repair protein ERCC-2